MTKYFEELNTGEIEKEMLMLGKTKALPKKGYSYKNKLRLSLTLHPFMKNGEKV